MAPTIGNLLYTTKWESEQRSLVVDCAYDHARTSHPPNQETNLPFMTGTLATRPSSTMSIGGLCMNVPSVEQTQVSANKITQILT